MKAYLVRKYKSPMAAGDAPEPRIGDHDVLVDIHAAGVNLLDAKIRDGDFRPFLPYKAPFILGHDLAGVASSSYRLARGLARGLGPPSLVLRVHYEHRDPAVEVDVGADAAEDP